MAYATLTYYKDTYKGATASDATITAYLDRASDDLDLMATIAIDTSAMGADQLALLAKATCAQAEGYIQNGDADLPSGSVSLGAFSISGGGTKRGGVFVRAYKYALMAGLCNRSVATSPARNLDELSTGNVIPGEAQE